MGTVTLTENTKAQVFAAVLSTKSTWCKVSGEDRTEVTVDGIVYVVKMRDPYKFLATITAAGDFGARQWVGNGSATVAEHRMLRLAAKYNR